MNEVEKTLFGTLGIQAGVNGVDQADIDGCITLVNDHYRKLSRGIINTYFNKRISSAKEHPHAVEILKNERLDILFGLDKVFNERL